MPWSRGNSSTASIITDPTQSKVERGKKIVCINHEHHQYQVLYSPLHPIKTLRHFLLIASSFAMCSFKRSPVTNLKPRTEKEWQSMHRKHKNIIQKQKERSAHQKLTTFRVPYRPCGNTICLRITLWSWASSSVVDRCCDPLAINISHCQLILWAELLVPGNKKSWLKSIPTSNSRSNMLRFNVESLKTCWKQY